MNRAHASRTYDRFRGSAATVEPSGVPPRSQGHGKRQAVRSAGAPPKPITSALPAVESLVTTSASSSTWIRPVTTGTTRTGGLTARAGESGSVVTLITPCRWRGMNRPMASTGISRIARVRSGEAAATVRGQATEWDRARTFLPLLPSPCSL